MKNIFVLVSFLLITTCLNAQKNKDSILIMEVMNAQVSAWNNGDIDKYMETYWESDSLLFISKSGPTYGYEQTKKNYKKGYPDTAAMGKLRFEIIQAKRLSVMYYSVVGKWNLTRSIGNVGGAFTLIFRKIKGKWVIIQDHSS
jgi:ketosteroid isomerase-like protein